MQIDGISIDRGKALAAAAAVGDRAADVIAAIADPDARTRPLEWTLGQSAAHLLADVRYHRAWLRREGRIDYFVPDLAEENRRGIDSVPERDPAALAAMVRQENAALVGEGAEQPLGAVFPEGVGPDLSLEVRTTLERVKALGGAPLLGPTPIPGVGAFALFQDPEGTRSVSCNPRPDPAGLVVRRA